jgi:hypothetical protein
VKLASLLTSNSAARVLSSTRPVLSRVSLQGMARIDSTDDEFIIIADGAPRIAARVRAVLFRLPRVRCGCGVSRSRSCSGDIIK